MDPAGAVIDPATRTGRVCFGRSWVEAAQLEVAGSPIFVELASLFEGLDQPAA